MIGTCTLRRIVNVIKESELDRLSTSQVMARASRLLSKWGTAVVELGAAGDGPTEGGAITPESSQSSEIDELIFMKENMRLSHSRLRSSSVKLGLFLGRVPM